MVLYRKRDFYFSGTSKLAGLGLGLGLEPSGLGLGLGLEPTGLGLGLGLETSGLGHWSDFRGWKF